MSEIHSLQISTMNNERWVRDYTDAAAPHRRMLRLRRRSGRRIARLFAR